MTNNPCHALGLSYMAAHADARRRMKRNQRQVFCETCQRWKWPNQLCPDARTRPCVATNTTKEANDEQ